LLGFEERHDYPEKMYPQTKTTLDILCRGGRRLIVYTISFRC